ncbi:hypothetical protein NP493_230g03042 [Ridgeia piscesae]|uniref:Uncharacterized protein n=1 Tax=Ridgeia piscesae TaxID=27915 RepID=A0AAD9UDR8_RIDPI|nr:hypothetical protein NP493_230g03042 [Ridgeia piscesae]
MFSRRVFLSSSRCLILLSERHLAFVTVRVQSSSYYTGAELIAIDRNTPEKVHDILAKQIHNKTKSRDLCTSDIKRLPAEVVDCPLLLAATLEDPTIIKYMVEKHEVNINFVHQEGTGRRLKLKTSLILAVRRGLYDTVEGILSVNADPNIQDQKGRT